MKVLVLAMMALGCLASRESTGDIAVVSGKTASGGPNWQNVFTVARVACSVTGMALIALRY
jgi:hypothetical protein